MFAFSISFVVLAGFLPLAMAAPGPTPVPAATAPASTSTAKLHQLIKSKGKTYFGTATDNPELTNQAYLANLDDNTMFGQITAANSFKWDATEPSRGVFTFANADTIANLARNNGQLLRGHNCVWHQQLPAWVTNGNFDAADLTSIIQTHCSTLVSHFKGQTISWDVVNEPLNDDGTFRQSVFFNTLGENYIPIALRAARAADPSTKLYINDFNIEGTGAKSTAMQNLVRSLQSQGVPIDGIGIQSHLIVNELPPNIQQNIQAFANLNVDVAITELDIRMTLPSTPALLQAQKADYTLVVQACMAVSRCIGITIWDWTDKFSFVPSTFPGMGAACPWDEVGRVPTRVSHR